MGKNLDFSYTNSNGKRVGGAAAFNHYVYTEKGSIQNYNDEVGEQYIKDFVNTHSDKINREITKQIKKSRFKRVV